MSEELGIVRSFPLITKVGNRGMDGLGLVWTPWPNDDWEIVEATGVEVEEVRNFLLIHPTEIGVIPRFEIVSTEIFNMQDSGFHCRLRSWNDHTSGFVRMQFDGTDPLSFITSNSADRRRRVRHSSASGEIIYEIDFSLNGPWLVSNTDLVADVSAVQIRFIFTAGEATEEGDVSAFISPFNQPPEVHRYPLANYIYPIPGVTKIYPLANQVGDLPEEE